MPPSSSSRKSSPENEYAMSLAEADMSLDNPHNATLDTTTTTTTHHHHHSFLHSSPSPSNNKATAAAQPLFESSSNNNYSKWNVAEARMELRKASKITSTYGLKLSTKWICEQLIGLPPSPPPSSFNGTNHFFTPFEEENENDATLYAKSLLDLGEYERAALVLSSGNNASAVAGSTIPPPLEELSSLGFFIRCYALYMAGERRKGEDVEELREPLERTKLRNPNLTQLSHELYDYYTSGALDAFGLYIYGVVLKELQNTPSASSTTTKIRPSSSVHHAQDIVPPPSPHSILLQSILQFPYNWSAWLDLSELCVQDSTIHSDVEEVLRPILGHWMYHFFCVHLFLENQVNENAIMVMEKLIHGTTATDTIDHETNRGAGGGETLSTTGMFVQSPYIQSQLAVAHYNLRDFDEAQRHFIALSERDSLRLDQMDIYSNILYVKEDRVSLSQLAHRAVKIDKYRPETCCIVGNYYSLKAQHEKAVQYFQRALKLDRSYLSAWTLMGHEYVEMKNTAAAIEAYRRAVDINERDYRAWYGLGQTYEILNMLFYALFYFNKAAALRPYDARMWCAIGNCYLGLDRRADAIRSYERAVSNNDGEGIATKKLATLYREDGDVERAARCYLRHLELRFQAQQVNPSPDGGYPGENDLEVVVNSVQVDAPDAEALLYLAYYHRDNGEFETAAMCCSRLLEYPGREKEEGKALLREIRSRMDRRGGGGDKEGGGGTSKRGKSSSSRNSRRMMDSSMSMDRSRIGGGNDNSLDSSAVVESSFEFSP
mmetsp:Transcript_17375/g.25507  ORF Transcript_17375/g.25507 Transcript_17375/m.25507 type:complete len:774 (+) Transcript_17375:151-2472(+)